jgi:hypothetical protein
MSIKCHGDHRFDGSTVSLYFENRSTLKKHQPAASVLSTPRLNGTRTLVVICTDCIGSYKSNYHTISNTTAPFLL